MSLSDEPAIRSLAEGPARWHDVRHDPVVTSTNDRALAALTDGVPPGLVVAAERQTAGRGRRGRRWVDDVVGPAGPVNLAITATTPAPPHAGLSPLVAGLAVVEMADARGVEARLKWPNDVQVAGRKLAGILVERHTVAGRDVLLIGCGLNVDWRGVPRQGDAVAWTSLAEETGGDVARGAALAEYLSALDRWLGALEQDVTAVLDAYRRQCSTIGVEVRVELPDGTVYEAAALDVDADGRLEVVVDGVVHRLAAGEVTHLRQAR